MARATLRRKIGYYLAAGIPRPQDEILRFVYDLTVGVDNSQARRYPLLRSLSDQISRSFRSQRNSKSFATGRSYIETGRKTGASAIGIIVQLFQDDPWKGPRVLPQQPNPIRAPEQLPQT